MQITVTLIIIAVTALISWQAFSKRDLFYKFMHYPFEEHREKEYYRWVTSMTLHGSLTHLLVNMFVLYGFGQEIESQFIGLFGEIMGRINFFSLYLFSGIFADIPTYLKNKNNPNFSSVGASGATSGIMFAYIVFYPWKKLYFLFFPFVGIPSILLAVLYLIYSSYASKKEGGRIDHEAHFWGAVFGFVFTIALKPELFSHFLSEVVNGLPF